MLFFSDKLFLCLSSHCQICEARGQEEGIENFSDIYQDLNAASILTCW